MADADEQKKLLTDWTERLTTALDVPIGAVDIDEILSLAGVAAHTVIRPAAPLTTYIVGYAAGLAAARSVETSAVRSGTDVALALCRDEARTTGDR